MAKEVDIHKDYILWQLVSNARSSISVLCSYMQKTTPYGKEYKNAFDAHTKCLKAFDKFEKALAETLEIEREDNK